MKKVIFICTGNTCRGPLAEGLFKKYLADRHLKAAVSSAGIAAFSGDSVSQNSVTAAKELGADISTHRARSLSPYDIDEADLLVCMSDSHYRALSGYADSSKLFLPKCEISDPFGMNIEEYKKCAAKIMLCFDDVSEKLFGFRLIDASPAHIEQIAGVERECFSSPWSEAALRAELEKPESRFFCAETGGEAVGYIIANNISGEVFISNVAVLPAHRKKGIASALIGRLISSAESDNADLITLEVRKSNTAAIALYSKFNFQKAGERKNFYTKPQEDAIIMTKQL